MSRAMNWVLLQLAMSYYGDSLKEFKIENEQKFLDCYYISESQKFHEITKPIQYSEAMYG